MGYLAKTSICSWFILCVSLVVTTQAANFEIVNNCQDTVWAAASPGGGLRLDRDQTWTFNVPPGTQMVRIWGRTGCNFDGSGRGGCDSGDCSGELYCTGLGDPPTTLANFDLNQDRNIDFYEISLLDGFNIPIGSYPLNNNCRTLTCSADINRQCPDPLRAKGGCNNPCTVFKTIEYCCYEGPESCGPTKYSRFFKEKCTDAFSYPADDDPRSISVCPSGSNYRVVFCPVV